MNSNNTKCHYVFHKAKIIFPVLVGTFLAAAFLNLFLMKIIMSVMFFMLVLMCNCSGDGRKFRRTSTVMYYMHMIFLFVLNMLCKQSMYGFVGFCFCCFMTNKEDGMAVRDSFKEMFEKGIYKADLFSDL